MKKMYKNLTRITFLAFAALLFLGISLKLSATTYYTGAGGTASNLNNWWTATNAAGTHPANFTTAGDIFTVQTGHTITNSGTSTWTVAGTLVINSGGIVNVRTTSLGALTIDSGGSMTTNRNFTVSGAVSISGSISFSSTSTTSRVITFSGDVTLNGGAVWNEPATGNGANNTFFIGGNFTNNAASFNALGTGVHTFSGTARSLGGTTTTSIGRVTITGSRTNSGIMTVGTTLAGTGTLTNGNGTTGTLNIGGSVSITGLTATAVNNQVNYTGAAQTAKSTTYYNLTLSGSLAKTFSTSPTVNGILSMEGSATIVVTTGVVTYGPNATLQYNSASSRTTSTEEWITPFAATGGVIIKNAGVIIMNEAKSFNASIPLTINSGSTLDTKSANSFGLTFGGNFVNNGGTLNAYASPITISNTMGAQSIAGFATTGGVTLSKTAGTATLLGNVSAASLTINGSGGTLNLGTALLHTFSGDINLTNGSLNGGSSTLHVNSTGVTSWNGNGALFTAGTGTVNFGGGAQSLAGTGTTTFFHLTVSNSGLKSFNNIPVVNGVFSLEDLATVSAAPTYGPGGTLQYNTAASRTAGVEWLNTFTASGGVMISNSGTITMNAAKIFGASAPLTIDSGSSLSMSSWLLTLNGNLINNGGSAQGTTGGITIAGTAIQSIGAFTTTGNVLMSKTGGTATFTDNVNGAALTVNGSGGTLNLGTTLTHTFTGVITLTAGSLNGGSSTLNENAVSTSAWNGNGNLFTPAASTIHFGASGNQTISATGLSFFNLAFSGLGNRIFSSSAVINNNLSFSGSAVANPGSFDHSSKSLTFNGSNQSAGTWGGTASNPNYINDTWFLSTATGVLNVNCTAPAAPSSGGNQTICSGQTIPSLSVTIAIGTADWYSLASGGVLLASNTLNYTPLAAGTFYAETDNNGCLSPSRTGVSLAINLLPAVLALTGSSVCSSPGGNGTITSLTSQTGVSYQLFNGSNVALGSAKPGTGSALTWSLLHAGTGFHVIGTNSITNCTSISQMVDITVLPEPDALVLSATTICSNPGGDGIISSATSKAGVNYQLFDESNTPIQDVQPGTGSGLDWTNLPAATGYYVKGTNATTSCVSSKSNTVEVATTPNPVALVLTGSEICVTPGNDGSVTSSTSEPNVDYQLFDDTDLEVGTSIPGTGAGITWSGLVSGTGYYAMGTSSTTSCTSDNSNAVNVSTNPNPTITTAAAASAVCFNTGAQSSSLSYSAISGIPSPATYSINWNAAANAAGLINVASTDLPDSPISIPVAAGVAGGTYTGTLYVSNGCSNAGNSFTLKINTAPSAPTGSAIQIFCSGATVANISATGSNIAWYATASGGTSLANSTPLVNGTHYFASQTGSGCESSSRLDVTANVVNSGSWIGTTGTNWFTTTNWCGGVIPSASTNITIAAGLNNYPSIGTAGAVCNNITIEPGASLTITGSNTLTVSGSWTKDGTFTSNSSTVDFSGSGAGNIGASNFYHVTVSGAGIKTATGVLTIAGNVSLTGNFTAGAFTHAVGGNWTNNGTFNAAGSTIDFNGDAAGNIGAGNFNHIIFSGAGAKTATGALTIEGNVNINNNFSAGAYTHTVGGNWTKSGIFTFAGSTIDFTGSGAGNIGAGNFNNIIFSGAGTKTASGGLNIIGSVTISGNFSAGIFTHTFQGDWTNNGTFHANTGTFLFNSISPQNIAGSSSSTFNNFIQNGLGVINLGTATSVSGTLTLTLGLIDIGNHNLTIISPGSVSGGSALSYVKTSGTGRLKQTVPGAGGSKIYPVGNAAYNPMTVAYNDISTSKNFSIRVSDSNITNANSSKTVNRQWFLMGDAEGSANLTLTATYNAGEEGAGFSNSSNPQIGYYDGTSWAYRPVTSGTGTKTFTSNGSAPDFSNASGFFALGSDDAFQATKLAVTNLTPANPTLGTANTTIRVQSQNSNGVPATVMNATGFSLSSTNTTMSTAPTAIIAQYAYETDVPSIVFTTSTFNTGSSSYNHNATVTASRTSGESLAAGTSSVFDVYDGAIWEPVATENWDAANGWRKSTDGGATWTNPSSLPAGSIFADSDLLRIPAGITLTANVTASFYSVLVYGTLELNNSGNLTLYHSSKSDYNIHVHGTLKNSGGTLTNSDAAHPFEIHGGTYWHNMNGGSIPVCSFYTLNSSLSTCKVTGITSTALTSGLDQIFENFTWDNASQNVTQNLSADLTVKGALTLTAGKITTGSHYVIVGLDGTATNSGAGYISGNLRRYVSAAVTTGDFPVGDANHYAPFSIAVNSGTPSGNGYLDVSTTAAQPTSASGLSQTKYINRKWTISNNGVAGITSYSPGCTFADADKVGSPSTGSLKMRKFTASTWYTTNGTATGNTITATGLSTAGLFAASDFYVGEDDCSATTAVWLGSISTDWNTAANWCSGLVPTATIDVIIPASSGRQPVIGSTVGTCMNITIQSGATLSISGAFTLDVKGAWTNSGTFTTGTETVAFTGIVAQTITGVTTFNNLTIDNSAGVNVENDITVNGVLTLASANPDATHGTLDMGNYAISMGGSSETTGPGDVTGIVRRQHAFSGNTIYSFGNQYTTIVFTNVSGGVKPIWLSCKIAFGTAPSWRNGAVKRSYSFAQDGTGTDRTITNLHYLDSEINGSETDETKLVFWDAYTGPAYGSVLPRGKSNNNSADNWIGLTGMAINFIAPSGTLDYKQWGLSYSTAAKIVWTGNGSPSFSGDWSLPGNWNGGVPTANDDVLIPASLPADSHGYPTRNLNSGSVPAVCKTLEIEAGASVAVDTYDLTVTGSSGAWNNSGTFIPGTGTVNFTHGNIDEIVTASGLGSNQFHNINIAANTFIKPGTGFHMKINGWVMAQLSSIVDLSSAGTTVEYNGASQIIVNPSHSGYKGYHNIIFSGTGTSTLYNGLLDIYGNFTSNGTLDLSNSTVSFIGAGPQIINGTSPVFHNLTIHGTGGVSATSDITVNGVLNLESANPSATKGSLDMTIEIGNYPGTTNSDYLSSYVLQMGSSATTTGIGDVTGTIRRSDLIQHTSYSFGNQFTTLALTAGTMPDALSLTVTIGASVAGIDSGKGIRRTYEIVPTVPGGYNSTAEIMANFHYLDSELSSSVAPYHLNTEDKLVTWDLDIGGGIAPDEHGRAGYDFANNYIGLSNVPIDYFIKIPSVHDWRTVFTLGDYLSDHSVWNGSVSTVWTEALNWTPNTAPPSDITHVMIPDANSTPNSPVLPSGTTTINTLTLEQGSVLTMGNNTLRIKNSLSGGWEDQNPDGNDPGQSTVLFLNPGATVSGTPRFFNIEIADGADITNDADCHMKIGGSITKTGTGKWFPDLYNTIIEYNGGDQTVLLPDGDVIKYHNLLLSGSGNKTMPSSAMILHGEFILSGTASATAAGALTLSGNHSNLILGPNTTFNAGSFTHFLAGNLENNGATFNTTGSAFNFNGTLPQSIGGTSASTFNSLTINNSAGITLGNNESVTGNLTFSAGIVTTLANHLSVGSAGTVNGAGSGKFVNGNLQKGISVSTSAIIFEIGNASDYLPVTLVFAGSATNGTGFITCRTTNGQQPEFASSGLNQARYINRYWTLTNSGVTFGTYDASFTFVNPGDVAGAASVSALLVKKYGPSSWSSVTTGSISSTGITTTGNTSFGDFVAAEASSNPSDYFRSASTGNWSSPSTWESSVDSITWGSASLVPDYNAHSIAISSGHSVNADETTTASNLYIIGTLTLGNDIGLSVNGIWQNSGYFDAGSGTIVFNGTSAQTINGTATFNNLTINNGAGVTANANQTVNGVLNLVSSNASSTKGTLHMAGTSEYVLYMGAGATTTGTGDVSGYVNRSSFELNTSYTFGNQFTMMKFTVGPLPVSVTMELYLAPVSWKPDAINRYIDVSRVGGTPDTRLRFNLHYLDSELNGANESNLDLFDYHVSVTELHDHGRTDYNSTDNWVGFANVGLAFLGTAATDDHYWTLGTSTTNDVTTWIGGSPSGPTDWDLPGNWEGGVPLETSHVVIPGNKAYYPLLPAAAMPDGSLPGGRVINTLEILTGGVLNVATGTPNLTVIGAAGAWQNYGILNAGNSTVIFTNAAATMAGSTNFNNVTIAPEAALTPETDNTMGIAGILNASGTIHANTHPNMIEFNGTGAQSVPALSYYDLKISGVRTSNDVTLSSVATTGVAGAFIPVATFTSGSYVVTSSTISFNGTLGGQELLHPFAFNNLILNNIDGFALQADETVNGTLTFTGGKISTGTNTLTIGSAGIIDNASADCYVDGRLAMVFSTAGSKTFAIGKGGNYRPLTFEYEDLTGTSRVTAEQIESSLPGTLPSNTILFPDRYWIISESGADSYHYSMSLNGTGYSPSHTGGVTIIKGSGSDYITLDATFAAPYYTNTTATTGFGNFGLGDSGNRWLGTTSNWFTGSNWTSGLAPSESDWFTIPADTPNDPVISTAAPVNISSSGKIEIKDLATLTLLAGSVLNFSEGANVNTSVTGRIIVKEGAAYVNLSSSTPTLQSEMTLTGSKGWGMIASPVNTTYSAMFASPMVTQGFNGSAYPDLQPNLLWWNETDGGTTLQAWRTPGSMGSNIPAGLGHFFYVFNGATKPSPLPGSYSDALPLPVSVTGVENFNGSGSFDFGLTKTARTTGTATSTTDITAYASNEGWNLVGNPTASTLDWDAESGWTKSGVDNTIYVWSSGGYLVWNGSTGGLGNGRIAPFQAFWVRANAASPVLSMNNGAKSVIAGTFKSAQTGPIISVPIRMKGLEMETTSYVSFSDGGVVGGDPKDAYRLQPMSDSWLALYMTSSVSHRDPLVINNLPVEIPETLNIPLFVEAGKSGKPAGGDMTLTWEIPGNWPSEYVIELIDNQQHKAISMLSQHTYAFKMAVSKSAGIRAVNPLDVPSLLIVPTASADDPLKSAVVSPFSIIIRKGHAGDQPVYVSREPELLPLAPNPFWSVTTISFTLPEPAPVRIDAFDLYGRLLETPVLGDYPAGLSTTIWTPKIGFKGICILRMTGGGAVSIQKGIRLKR